MANTEIMPHPILTEIRTKCRAIFATSRKSKDNKKASQPAQANTLTCFSALPVEIQLMIWTEAIADHEPKVLKLIIYTKHRYLHGQDLIRFSSESVPHFFLSLTQASREAMIKACSSIAQPGLQRIIRFHPQDTVLLISLPLDDISESLVKLLIPHEFYPTFPGTTVQDVAFGERSVNPKLVAMLSGVQKLAIPRLWLYLNGTNWEDRTSKALFLAHFSNLQTLVFTKGVPDVPPYLQIPKGNFEVYLQDELEYEEHGIRRSGNREEEVETARLMFSQKNERAIEKLQTFQLKGSRPFTAELEVKFKVVRRTRPGKWRPQSISKHESWALARD